MVLEFCVYIGGGYFLGLLFSVVGEVFFRVFRGYRGWKVFLWGLVYFIFGIVVNFIFWLVCRFWGGCFLGLVGF